MRRRPARPGALFGPDGKTPGDDLDAGKPGVDYRWEHIVTVFDAQGNLIEDWTQWDKMFRRPHAVYISPYDAEKNVWIVDDYRHAIFKFSHDGKKLLQTIGEPNVPGTDDKHFYRPTFMAWLPDGTFFVADGYQNTRVVKFDKDGKYLMTWGQRGTPPEKRPELLQQRARRRRRSADAPRVRQRSRQRPRAGVRRERQVSRRVELRSAAGSSDIHMFIITSDRFLWAADRGTSKLVKYSLDGKFLYSWGVWGDFPGAFWGVHGMSVDQEGNVYTAAVDSGGAQKFTPRKGANPAFLLGKQVNPGWKYEVSGKELHVFIEHRNRSGGIDDFAHAQPEARLHGRVGRLGARRHGRVDLRARARAGADRAAAAIRHRRLAGHGRLLRQHPAGDVPPRLGALDGLGAHQRSHRPRARADADDPLLLGVHVHVRAGQQHLAARDPARPRRARHRW